MNINHTRRPAPVFHDIDISVAPECEGDLLAAAPRLFTDDAGDAYLQLQGGEPTEDADVIGTYRVLERKDLLGANITIALVQHSTRNGVYIFPTPERELTSQPPVEALEALAIDDREVFIAAAVADPDVRKRLRQEMILDLSYRLGRLTRELGDEKSDR